jgi:hypothetical protein
MELFNIQELTRLAAAAPHDEGHAGLLSALRERYPDVEFLLAAAGGEWSSCNRCLVDASGNKIADDFSAWARAEYDAAGQDINALWEKYRDAGLVLGEVCGTTLYIAAPYSSDPDAFFQIEIELSHEVTSLHAFPSKSWGPPEDLADLCSPFMLHGVEDTLELSLWRYKFRRLTNMRQFLKEMNDVERRNRLAELPEMERKVIRTTIITESGQAGNGCWDVNDQVTETPFLDMFPDWLDRLPPGVRFFQDWKESSASAWRLCDHWRLELNDYTDKDGKRHMSITPQWANSSPGLDLPEISPDYEASPYGVMESLIQFDELLGVKFGWYFYALHGNRITGSAISVVARGVKEGKIRLLERDEKVVLRWDESSYGF